MDTVHALHAAAGRFATPRRCHDFVAQHALVYKHPLSPEATAFGQQAWLATLGVLNTDKKPPAHLGLLGPEPRLSTMLKLKNDPPADALAEAEKTLNAPYARRVFAEIGKPFPEGAVRLVAQLGNKDSLCVVNLYEIALAQAEAEHLAMTSDISPEVTEAVLSGVAQLDTLDNDDDDDDNDDNEATMCTDLVAVAEFCEHNPADGSPLETLAKYLAEARATMNVAEQMEP